MSRRNRDNGTTWRHLIALAGWWGVAIGVAGLIWHRSLYPLWIALIAFGLAGAPRPILDWIREHRRKQ